MKIENSFAKSQNNKFHLKKTLKTKENLCIYNTINEIFKTKCNIDNFDLSERLWTQITVDGTIFTPLNIESIKEIDSINAKVKILQKKLLKAPSALKNRDFEGLKGGERLIKVEGLICFSINYIPFSSSSDEKIHTIHDTMPFSTVIDLPSRDSNGRDTLDFLYTISACIEDIRLNSIVDRTLNLTVILIISAFMSFNKEDFCISEEYLKNLNISCEDEKTCKSCNDENEVLIKGVFPQEKIENILNIKQSVRYRKRLISTDVLKLTDYNPNIIKILSFNFNIKILCQRVIKTPFVLGKNLENKKLTGFMLLIDYIIEHNIIYSASTSCESIHSATFDNIDSFYITVPDTTNLTDKFKISYYVDDVYVCILNDREIFKSISILFHANPIYCKNKPINTIIFNGQDDKELVSIDIYTNSNLFKVNSTSEIANLTFSEKYYFSFQVTDSNENQKYLSTVNGDENADNFELSLNNKSFEEGDLINLTYRERNRVIISNYNDEEEFNAKYFTDSNSEEVYNPKYFSESYRITSEGLEANNPIIFNNIITFKGKDDIEVAIVRFNVSNKTLIVDSSGLEANTEFSDEVYFSLEVKDSTDILKFKSEVYGNDDADNFKNDLNKKPFALNDILTLNYKESKRVLISNYEGEDEYDPEGISESYEITINGLKPVRTGLDENVITFKGKDDNNIAIINFNSDQKILVVQSTNIIANSDFQGKPYFSFELTNSNGIQKQKVTVNGNQNANHFMNTLNNVRFEDEDLINLSYRERNKVIVSNYEEQNQYNPKYFSESYRITLEGLEPNNPSILNNVITFKGKNNIEVAIVRFNTDNRTLIVGSSGLQSNIDFLNNIYFSFQIKDAFNTEKIKSTVLGNEDADNFIVNLNDFNFNFGDILTLEYKENSRVNITNYEGKENYNPGGYSESYQITTNGLKKLTNIRENYIVINGSDNFLGSVKFSQIDFVNNQLIVSSTGKPLVTMFSSNCFQLIIKDSNFKTKNSLYVNGQDNAENFKNIFNNYPFNIGDIIRFRYITLVNILVANYLGHVKYTGPKYTSSFQITPNGLRPVNVDFLKNTIILNRTNEPKEVVIINFTKKELKLFVNPSGGRINNSNFKNKEYFRFTLKKINGLIIQNEFINGNQNAINFSTALDEQTFSYGDILRLKYRETSMVIITNFNNQDKYNPKFYSERYNITANGLELLNNKILQNIITFKGKNNNKIAILRFDATERIFIADSSGMKPDESLGSEQYFLIILKESDNSVKLTSMVTANENADNFSNTFDEKSFNFGNILTLQYRENIKIEITNLEGQEIYNPSDNQESYLITENGLIPLKKLLQNIITFRGRGRGDIGSFKRIEMSSIQFDKETMKLIVTSTEQISNTQGSSQYFSFSLLNSSGVEKNKAFVNNNQNATAFANTLNKTSFEYNDSITLEYADASRVDIINFNGETVYHPIRNTESYIITSTGLIKKS